MEKYLFKLALDRLPDKVTFDDNLEIIQSSILEGVLRVIQRYFFFYFSTKVYVMTPH